MKSDAHVDLELAGNQEFNAVIRRLRDQTGRNGGWVDLTRVRSKPEAALVFPILLDCIAAVGHPSVRYYILRAFRVRWAKPWIDELVKLFLAERDPFCEGALAQALTATCANANAVQVLDAVRAKRAFENDTQLIAKLHRLDSTRAGIEAWIRELDARGLLDSTLSRLAAKLHIPEYACLSEASNQKVKISLPIISKFQDEHQENASDGGITELWSGECEIPALLDVCDELESRFGCRIFGKADIARKLQNSDSHMIIAMVEQLAGTPWNEIYLFCALEDVDTVLLRLLRGHRRSG